MKIYSIKPFYILAVLEFVYRNMELFLCFFQPLMIEKSLKSFCPKNSFLIFSFFLFGETSPREKMFAVDEKNNLHIILDGINTT